MRERIKKLMQSEDLTPGKLAEKLGVQPSSISHLLSGRNKPGFDFIAKGLEVFPDLNPYWLLLGREPMYNGGEGAPAVSVNEDTPPAKRPFFDETSHDEAKQGRTEIANSGERADSGRQAPASPTQDNDCRDETLFTADAAAVKGLEPPIPAVQGEAEAPLPKIEQIIIFTDNGKFRRYTHE